MSINVLREYSRQTHVYQMIRKMEVKISFTNVELKEV